MRVISKNIGAVSNLHVHIVLIEDESRPFLLFSDAEDDSPILIFDSKSLRKLIRILHNSIAEINKYLRSKEARNE